MSVFDLFRDKAIVEELVGEIRRRSTKRIALMEVCGGHTMAIQRFGLPALLPPTIELKSGPGCPVCVSGRNYIDHAVALSRLPGHIITTFGDLIRVPGSTSTLEKEKERGGDIRIVYSPLDALYLARENPGKNVVFLGIGFETTAPGTAATLHKAKELNIGNFYLLSAHKIMPPVMAALVDDGVRIDGYICPGHVSTITGSGIYEDLPRRYGLGCVIAGFEPVDILSSILMLVRQLEEGKPSVEIQYRRAVRPEGNTRAQALLSEVYEPRDDWWRGIGTIPGSGLKIRSQYAAHDAEVQLEVEVEPTREDPGCICGEILKGVKRPDQCRLFGRGCDPANPVGACMVSQEGACHAHYRYNRHDR
jgi:hydrogenase expression/formation protein HypD